MAFVADFDGAGADSMLEGLPDGDWGDAGGPVEVVLCMELLERIEGSAPDPLGRVAGLCAAALVAATEAAIGGPDPRLN